MSQIDKLKNKFYEKPVPNDIEHDEVARLFKYYGCIVESGGKHQMKVIHVASGTVIPIPCHGNHVGEAYIKELKKLLDILLEED